MTQKHTDFRGVIGLVVAVLACIGTYLALPQIQNILFLASKPTIALIDTFDDANGSYDTNLWICANECNVDYLFLQNGVLNLQRQNKGGGWTSITSRSKWAYDDVTSLTGKFQISKNLNQGEVGWLGFVNDVSGCGIWGTDDPYIQCSVGPYIQEAHEYQTNDISIKPNIWYTLKYEFDQKTSIIRFYLDNTLMGEYILTNFPDTLQISIGIYAPDNNTSSGEFFIDDVVLTLKK